MTTPQPERIRKLFLAEQFQAHWEHVVGPWLRQRALTAWQQALPVVVLIPSRNYGWFLRSRLLNENVNFAGIEFWTPVDIRSRLLARFPDIRGTLPREHLHLLLAVAAESVAAKNPDNRSAAAVAAEPAMLLRTIDQVTAAGWDFADAGIPPLRPVAQLWQKMLVDGNAQTLQQIDRQLEQKARDAVPGIESLFVIGFDGAHWPQWPMIAAAIHHANEAELCLFSPREEAGELDRTWIGLCEETFGVYEELHPSEATRAPNSSLPPDFLLADQPAGEARAIVCATLRFLSGTDAGRIGLLFPGRCALSREVALLLQELEIPHNDALGHHRPGSFEQPDWQTWMQLQSMPGIENLLRFLQQTDSKANAWWPLESDGSFLSLNDIGDSLRQALRDTLFDDLYILGSWLRQSKSKSRSLTGHLLQSIVVLPEQGTLTAFIEATVSALNSLGWKDRARFIREEAQELIKTVKLPFSRATWLHWLAEIANSMAYQRQLLGDQFYSRVHLVSYADAERQDWSHLVLTSLAEGVWPPRLSETSYLSGQEITRLNQSIKRLNQRAVRQGGQGEGHESVEPGKGMCLGPVQQQGLVRRAWSGLLENSDCNFVFTASLNDEAAAGVRLNPGEFMSGAYCGSHNRSLGQEEMNGLIQQTRTLIQSIFPKLGKMDGKKYLLPTKIAWSARREIKEGFGKYEFAHSSTPAEPLTLSCGEWQRAISSPALTWMQKELGVQYARDADFKGLFSWAIGAWAHQWLAAMSDNGQWTARPADSSSLHSRIEQRAARMHQEVKQLFAAASESLPVWWELVWRQARHYARELAAASFRQKDWKYLSTEYKLSGRFTSVAPDNEARLWLSGRIDLLLGDGDHPPEGRLPADCHIIDYKTGGDKELNPHRLRKGDGIQLALYALGIRDQGAQKVALCLLRPGGEIEDQLTIDDVQAESSLWLDLVRMQNESCFGMYGELRPRFGSSARYPLATLEIDPAILAAKWKKSHPAWKEVLRDEA